MVERTVAWLVRCRRLDPDYERLSVPSKSWAKDLILLARDEAVQGLIEHSSGADMLAIGIGRRSPVGKLVMGSDARDILLQSHVPVLAVHDDVAESDDEA